MSRNQTNLYDLDPHLAEVYDQTETSTADVELIRRLIGPAGSLSVLEPFCGTGRILIPLALDGHTVVGLDQAETMLARARARIGRLPPEVQRRITVNRADATAAEWPQGFDLVVLGANCLYELATAAEQEGCIASAAGSLKPGGHLYLDNDHMEGGLDQAWRKLGTATAGLGGRCSDGALVESWIETTWFDAERRLVQLKRRVRVTLADGRVTEHEYEQQKHPVSALEVQSWLDRFGFRILGQYGDREGNPYSAGSGRAIFWVVKR